MKNQVIEVLDKEHGKKVIEYWESQGVDTRELTGSMCKKNGFMQRFYGVINGTFYSISIYDVYRYDAEIIELPEENSFPRVMLVSDDAVVWNQAVAVCLQGGYAFATFNYCSVEEYEDALKRGGSVSFYFWKYHKELSDRNKVSKAEIAEKFNIPLDKLEIVD